MPDQPVLQRTPLRFVIRDAGNDEVYFCCPVCGNDYVHQAKVIVDQGQTRTEVTGEQTRVVASDHGMLSRGSQVAMQLWCEAGHAFEYRLSFNKGHLTCELATWPLAAESPREELWRN
jgi:hypothetical protein